MSSAHEPRLLVIGAGITGLAAAHRAGELRPGLRITALEASSRAGGVVATEQVGGFTLEGGPDSFVTEKPWALDLCKRLGLGDELLPTNEQFRRTLIVRDGRLVPLPDAFQLLAPARLTPFLLSPILSWRGRFTALKDLFLPRGGPGAEGDESLASFVRRRLGDEVLARIAQPMVGGIYAADPETLSLASTMPRFLDLERQQRSLILGLLRQARDAPQAGTSGARFGLFLTLRHGIGSVVSALEQRLPAGVLRTNARVVRLAREPNAWRAELADGRAELADAVIVALPAPRAAEILDGLDPALAVDLHAIAYASTAVVSLAYRRAELPVMPEAFGFVVPRIENRRVFAGSFSSVKYAGRAPNDTLLLRLFAGGALQPELFALDDASLLDAVRGELRGLLGIRAEPALVRIHRWAESMPQYRVGHARAIERIEHRAATHPGLALAGNAFHGVGLADCVRSAERAAESVLAFLPPIHESQEHPETHEALHHH